MTATDWYQKGNAYRQQGDWKHALDCYMEAIELDPESPAVEAKAIIKMRITHDGISRVGQTQSMKK